MDLDNGGILSVAVLGESLGTINDMIIKNGLIYIAGDKGLTIIDKST